MVMKIKTYTGNVDPGFQGYEQRGIVDNSAKFDGMDLAGLANFGKTAMEGALSIDKANKIAYVGDAVNKLTQEYLDRSPTDQMQLRNEALDIQDQLSTETDPLAKTQLENRITEITTKLENSVQQGRMGEYEFHKRLNAEVGPILQNNPHLGRELMARINRSLNISGVSAAMKYDNQALALERDKIKTDRNRINNYLFTHNITHDPNASMFEKQELVQNHMAKQQLKDQLEDDKALQELNDATIAREFKAIGGPRLIYEIALEDTANNLLAIANSDMDVDTKRTQIALTLSKANVKYKSKFDLLPEDAAFTRYMNDFDDSLKVFQNLSDDQLSGDFVKKTAENLVSINKAGADLELMGDINPAKLDNMAKIADITKKLSDVSASKFGQGTQGAQIKGQILTTLVGVMKDYSNGKIYPGVSKILTDIEDNGKTPISVITSEMTKSATNIDTSIINMHKFKDNDIVNEANAMNQLTKLDDAMIQYGSPEYKDKLSVIAGDSEMRDILSQEINKHVQYSSYGIEQYLRNAQTIPSITMNEVTGTLTTDDPKFQQYLNRFNAQLNVMKNLDKNITDETIGEYAQILLKDHYKFLHDKMNNNFSIDLTDADVDGMAKIIDDYIANPPSLDSLIKPVEMETTEETPEVAPTTEDKPVVEEGEVPTEQEEQVMQNIFNYKKGDGSNEFRTYNTKEDAVKDVANQIDRYVKGIGVAEGRPAIDIRTFLNLYRPASDYQGGDDITQRAYEDFLVSQVLPEGSTATTPIKLTDSDYIAKLLKALAKQETGTVLTIEEIQGYLN